MNLPEFGIDNQMMWAVIACLVMMLIDVLSGFLTAWKNKSIQSTVMREGLFHKATLVLLIILAWIIEFFVMKVPELGIDLPLVLPVCIFIFAMEVVSILENMVKMYPELEGSKLLDIFKLSKKEGDHAKRN